MIFCFAFFVKFKVVFMFNYVILNLFHNVFLYNYILKISFLLMVRIILYQYSFILIFIDV